MRFALVLICLLIASGTAQAEEITIGWGDAIFGGDDVFGACEPGNEVQVLVCKFKMPTGLSKIYRMEATLDFCTLPLDLPPWWGGEGSDACVEAQLIPGADFTQGPSSAVDYWNGNGVASMTFETPVIGNPVRARAVIAVDIDPGLAPAAVAGTEYYAFKFIIDGTGTTCAGCDASVCFMLNGITLTGPEGDVRFYSYYDSAYARWNGGGGNCPFIVPVEDTSFGALKALYR